MVGANWKYAVTLGLKFINNNKGQCWVAADSGIKKFITNLENLQLFCSVDWKEGDNRLTEFIELDYKALQEE